MKKSFLIFWILTFLVTFNSCTTDDLVETNAITESVKPDPLAKSSSYPCTAGLEILDGGNYTNIGGNGGIALNASASSLSGAGQSVKSLSSGNLYRRSATVSSLSNGTTFTVTNGGAGNVWVRVVGKSATNEVLLLSAKKLAPSYGSIQIRVCNKSSFTSSGYTDIRFEIYALGNTWVGWSLG